MKGLIVALLSAASLMFSSCLGCNGCVIALDSCDEDHTDGVCDMCNSEILVEQISDNLEICENCMGRYGETSGCDACF